MTLENHLPNLFGYGRGGVPGEFRSYLSSLEVSARIAAGADPAGPHDVTWCPLGVAEAAKIELEQLRTERALHLQSGIPSPKKHKVDPPKVRKETLTVLYLLHAHCAYENKAAPPELLWLTFETLGLANGAPAIEVERKLRLPQGVRQKQQWFDASELDGEADGIGKTLTEKELQSAVVARALAREEMVAEDIRKRLRTWRLMPQYKARRDYVAYLARLQLK